jgi:hypothetical protein
VFVSPDGLALLQQATSGLDIVMLPLTGEKKLSPIVATPPWELNATFAPDNHAIAYASDLTGRFEVLCPRIHRRVAPCR